MSKPCRVIRFPGLDNDEWAAITRQISAMRSPAVVYPAREAIGMSEEPARDGLPSDSEAE